MEGFIVSNPPIWRSKNINKNYADTLMDDPYEESIYPNGTERQ